MNKRYFNDKKVVEAYRENGVDGIKSLIGKTEVFMYDANSSLAKQVIELVLNDETRKVTKLLKSCT